MNLNLLELLVLVAENGNLSQAARKLGISSSLASRRLSELERVFGARLVVRTTRVSHLTPAGRALFDWAKTTVDGFGIVSDEIALLDGAPKGLVRVASNEYMIGYRLPPLIGKFAEMFPGIRVELTVSDDPFRLLDTHDFAIHAGARTPHNLYFRKIYTFKRALCASPGYIARFGSPQRPADLADHRLVAHSHETDAWLLRRGDETFAHRIAAHASANSFIAVFGLAEAGMGIARLSTPLLRRGLAQNRLTRVLDGYEVVYPQGEDPSVWFVHSSDQILKRAQLLMDFIEAEIEKD